MSAPAPEPAAPESGQLGVQVALATLALLCYRLIFCTHREPTLTALLFCASCAWCAGQLAGGASYEGLPSVSAASALARPALAVVSAAASFLGSSVRMACQYAGLEAAARDACWRYTAALVGAPPE
jgi:hypothetical protein